MSGARRAHLCAGAARRRAGGTAPGSPGAAGHQRHQLVGPALGQSAAGTQAGRQDTHGQAVRRPAGPPRPPEAPPAPRAPDAHHPVCPPALRALSAAAAARPRAGRPRADLASGRRAAGHGRPGHRVPGPLPHLPGLRHAQPCPDPRRPEGPQRRPAAGRHLGLPDRRAPRQPARPGGGCRGCLRGPAGGGHRGQPASADEHGPGPGARRGPGGGPRGPGQERR